MSRPIQIRTVPTATAATDDDQIEGRPIHRAIAPDLGGGVDPEMPQLGQQDLRVRSKPGHLDAGRECDPRQWLADHDGADAPSHGLSA
jgi:hypothetical protein